MRPFSTRKRRRWLLAAWEALLMAWFLMLCLMFAGFMLNHPEAFAGTPVAFGKMPELTKLIRSLVVESGPGMLIFSLGTGTGFGSLVLTSRESITSRLFRWTVIAALTVLWGAFLPVFEQHHMIGAVSAGSFSTGSFASMTLAGSLGAFGGLFHAWRRMHG
ncbi:hypothetical protein [Prosthecobacter sp.]|jgi:hypothetical protein|uniref:hypothetical protein n=1 Tax=Prosthecobacter sp. TaxID=1965333 RepID=UPI0037843152